jgi:hypothetical protein
VAANARFLPAQCPGCGAPVAAKYSHYRHAHRHRLFGVLLITGVLSSIALVLLSLWGTAHLTALAIEGKGLRPKERGMVYCIAFAATLPAIAWLSRLWWRALHRLPRHFEYECEVCRCVATFRVSEG